MKNKQSQAFAKRLRESLEMRKMKQADLSRKTGISKPTISQYLSGSYVPKKDNIDLIADALGVTDLWLMGYKNAPMTEDDQVKQTLDLANSLDERSRLAKEIFFNACSINLEGVSILYEFSKFLNNNSQYQSEHSFVIPKITTKEIESVMEQRMKPNNTPFDEFFI